MPLRLGDYVRQRSDAARWIFERRNVATHWGWAVLTAHNPDPETLNFPDITAFQIFTDLAERRLLVPALTNQGIEAFVLNLGAEDKWAAVISPPGWFRRYVVPIFSWLFRNGWAALIWLIGALITALLSYIFSK